MMPPCTDLPVARDSRGVTELPGRFLGRSDTGAPEPLASMPAGVRGAHVGQGDLSVTDALRVELIPEMRPPYQGDAAMLDGIEPAVGTGAICCQALVSCCRWVIPAGLSSGVATRCAYRDRSRPLPR
jgi:hypothetical protein